MTVIPLIAHLILSPGSVPGVGWVRRNQTNGLHDYKLVFYYDPMNEYLDIKYPHGFEVILI